jgi:hypothetical protein
MLINFPILATLIMLEHMTVIICKVNLPLCQSTTLSMRIWEKKVKKTPRE